MVRQDLAAAPADESHAEELVVAKTGKTTAHWTKVLARFGAASKPTAASVDHLQERHGVSRAWARTLVTEYVTRHG
jgi:Domain of unknown function (DUF4287)